MPDSFSEKEQKEMSPEELAEATCPGCPNMFGYAPGENHDEHCCQRTGPRSTEGHNRMTDAKPI